MSKLTELAKIVDEARRTVESAEKDWRSAADACTPEDWRKAIDGIGDKIVRIQAACLVWWDFFGERPWSHLDDYKAAWKMSHHADMKKVREALVQIGYYTGLAGRRAAGQNVIEEQARQAKKEGAR